MRLLTGISGLFTTAGSMVGASQLAGSVKTEWYELPPQAIMIPVAVAGACLMAKAAWGNSGRTEHAPKEP